MEQQRTDVGLITAGVVAAGCITVTRLIIVRNALSHAVGCAPLLEVMEPADLDDTALRLAVAACLGRHTGASRTHSEMVPLWSP